VQGKFEFSSRGNFSVKLLVRSSMFALAAAAALSATPALAELKVGVLDYGRLMDESPQGKTLLESLRNDASAKQRELQTAAQSLQSRKDKLVKDRATMSPDQVSRSEKDIRDSERDLARRQSEIQDDFNARRNEEMSKLQRSLIEEVRAYAKAQNFDLVVTDGVIYATPSLDITPGVLQVLQARGAPAAAPAAAPKPAGR
jgi:outer membrane protein